MSSSFPLPNYLPFSISIVDENPAYRVTVLNKFNDASADIDNIITK